MKVSAIKAAAGLGKTRGLIEMISYSRHAKVEYYVPDHQLAAEVSALVWKQRFGRRAQIIKGRSQMHDATARMCARHGDAERLSANGYPVFPVLCAKRVSHGNIERCTHYSKCPYILQFSPQRGVRIYTHAALPLERGFLDGGIPQLAVIDESFFKVCIESFVVAQDALRSSALGPAATKVFAAVLDALLTKKPLLQHLRTENLMPDLKQALVECEPGLPYFSPWWSEQRQQKFFVKLKPRPKVYELLLALKVELASERDEAHGIRLHATGGIRVDRKRPITRFAQGANSADIIIIDADASPVTIEPWFPGATYSEIPAPRNAYVMQCSSTRGSTTSMVPERNADPASKAKAEDRLDDIQHLIDRKAAEGKRVLVVGPQHVTGNPAQGQPPRLTCPEGGELAHFGAIRGVDRWKDFNVIIVVGRNEPPLDAVQDMARAIWCDSPEPLRFVEEWSKEMRGYRMRDPQELEGAETITHPDPRVQALVEQIRECETAQATDRLRLVHAEEPKEVFLLSNVPTAVVVDELRNWKEVIFGSRIEQALAKYRGVLPLAPSWLALNCPDLWESEGAAKNDVTRLGQKDHSSNSIYIRKMSKLTYNYWLAGQTNPARALSTLPVHETQTALTKLLGVPVVLREGHKQPKLPKYFGGVGWACMALRTAAGFGFSEAAPA